MSEFWKRFFDPEHSLGRYIIGTAALTVAIQIAYDLAKEPFGLAGAAALAGILFLIVILILYIDYKRVQEQRKNQPEEKSNVPAHSGLLILVSPQNLNLAIFYIEHHLSQLRHCWLISTTDSLSTADQLEQLGHEMWPQVDIYSGQQYKVDPESLESSYNMVERIFSKEAPDHGLSEVELIADLTGGTKPMTAGMTLACTAPGRRMQYVKSQRTADGKVVRDGQRTLILITTQKVAPARQP